MNCRRSCGQSFERSFGLSPVELKLVQSHELSSGASRAASLGASPRLQACARVLAVVLGLTMVDTMILPSSSLGMGMHRRVEVEEVLIRALGLDIWSIHLPRQIAHQQFTMAWQSCAQKHCGQPRLRCHKAEEVQYQANMVPLHLNCLSGSCMPSGC